jgi:hypothetical protein
MCRYPTVPNLRRTPCALPLAVFLALARAQPNVANDSLSTSCRIEWVTTQRLAPLNAWHHSTLGKLYITAVAVNGCKSIKITAI